MPTSPPVTWPDPGPPSSPFDARSTPSPSHHDSAVLGDTSKWISFGLASTSGDRHDPFTNWLAYATDVPDPIDLARRSIVTPTCGLGSTDQSTAEQAFRRAADVSQAIRRVADQRTGTAAERLASVPLPALDRRGP